VHDASRLHPSHEDDVIRLEPRRRAIALSVLCLCALTTAIDITITNVALPFIGQDLDASVAGLQLVVDAYNIVLAGLLVLGGGLADRFGRRMVFLGGYALFGVSCLLAAFSPSTGALIGARAVMGVGAAAVIAPALAIVATMYPPEDRGRAIGLWAVFGATGLALGPILGGLLLDRFWWGSVFLVNVPLVVLGVAVGFAVLPDSRKPASGSLDVLGALLSFLGLGALLLGIIEGPQQGWTSPPVVFAVVAGIALTAGFVVRELTTASPLFDVRILARPVVAAGSVTLFVGYVLMTGMLFVVPQWLEGIQGQSIVNVGLLLVPFAAVFGVASTYSASTVQRFGARATITGGLLLGALGIGGLAAFSDAALETNVVATALVGLGLAGVIAPPSTVVMNDLPPAKAGDGSSTNMVSRFVGGAVGVAVMGSVLSSVYRDHLAPSTRGLSIAQVSEARGSLQGGLEVATELTGGAHGAFAASVRDAFNTGARAGYAVVAVFTALACVWVWRALRPGISAPTRA
jgi:EmrB/QacA subfamily drug resistance transporter